MKSFTSFIRATFVGKVNPPPFEKEGKMITQAEQLNFVMEADSQGNTPPITVKRGDSDKTEYQQFKPYEVRIKATCFKENIYTTSQEAKPAKG